MRPVLPYHRQENEVYCGPAVVQMILDSRGIGRTQKELAEELGTDESVGTRQSSLAKVLASYGFITESRSGVGFEDLETALGRGSIVIVGYLEPADDTPHYAILSSLDTDTVTLEDPEHGPNFTMPRGDFERRWRDDGNGAYGDRMILTVSEPAGMGGAEREREIRRWFRYGVFLKGLLAVFEIVGGVITILIKPSLVLKISDVLTADELAEDSHDYIAAHLATYAHMFAYSPHVFIGSFVLVDGLLKLVVVALLLKEKLWAYPFALAVLALFAIYEVVRFFQTHSVLLIMLVFFDVIIVWFIWREYTVVSAHLKARRRV